MVPTRSVWKSDSSIEQSVHFVNCPNLSWTFTSPQRPGPATERLPLHKEPKGMDGNVLEDQLMHTHNIQSPPIVSVPPTKIYRPLVERTLNRAGVY